MGNGKNTVAEEIRRVEAEADKAADAMLRVVKGTHTEEDIETVRQVGETARKGLESLKETQ